MPAVRDNLPARTPPPTEGEGAAPKGITQPQQRFLLSLLDERNLTATEQGMRQLAEAHMSYSDWVQSLKDRVPTMTMAQASAWIGRLRELPKHRKRANPSENLPDVPGGYYAVTGLDGVTKFYRVDRPEEGRWAGWTFLKVQASDEFHPIKDTFVIRQILARIEEDPAAAAKLYGQEIGSCGVCGRTLTDETSRAYGIGPICRERTGW